MLVYIVGLAVTVVLGSIFGWALGSSAVLDRAFGPLLDFFRSMPAPALIPVFIVLLGTNLVMGVVVMVATVIWPILLNAASARRSIHPVRLEMATALGMSWWARKFKVVFPSLVPDIMIGVRTAATTGLVVALVLDILGSGSGWDGC